MCDSLGTMTEPTYTGLDLKIARTRARVKAKHIAVAMGVSASRVASLEREAIVTADAADRYLRAVDECRTVGTSSVA
jgi:DNA-binding transcriptional regulator YiaG